MPTVCELSMLDTPLVAELADVVGAPLVVFFALGIVNPRGPTLTIVAAVGRAEPGAKLPVVHIMLNPFSQQVEQVAHIRFGDVWNPRRDLAPLMALDFGSCPTLVLLNPAITEDVRAAFAADLLAHFVDDVISVAATVTKYFGNPWRRVGDAGWHEADDATDEARIDAAIELGKLVTHPDHMGPELQAFIAAWRGSIELTGISPALKDSALSPSWFREFFIHQVGPSVWIPQAADTPPPKPSTQVEFVAESLEQVRAALHDQHWSDFSNNSLLELLRAAMLLYAVEIDQQDIPPLGELYSYVVRRTDAEQRLLLVQQVTQVVEKERLSCVAFLPVLVREPDEAVASTAMIDFVSCSAYLDSGELYALVELRGLLTKGVIENTGAVFGALVSLGQRAFWPYLDDIRPLLSTDDVQVAARIHTPYLRHGDVQYWLQWAEELVDQPDPQSQRNFGNACSAIGLARQIDRTGIVVDAERQFPCAAHASPIHVHQQWSINDYATLLAPRLYALEAREAAPKLISHVLRIWGLAPDAPLIEQFIPDSSDHDAPFEKLRKPDPDQR